MLNIWWRIEKIITRQKSPAIRPTADADSPWPRDWGHAVTICRCARCRITRRDLVDCVPTLTCFTFTRIAPSEFVTGLRMVRRVQDWSSRVEQFIEADIPGGWFGCQMSGLDLLIELSWAAPDVGCRRKRDGWDACIQFYHWDIRCTLKSPTCINGT